MADGELVCLIPGPRKELIRRPDGVRWCFGCRKHLPHDLVVLGDERPSYYDPVPVRLVRPGPHPIPRDRLVMGATHISEAEWQEQVVQLAHALGWRHLHVRRSIGKGRKWVTATNVPWPDLTLWSERQQRLIVAELKTDTGQPTDGQIEVLSSLARAGIEAHLWRPCDLDDVHRTLTGSRPWRPATAASTSSTQERPPPVTDDTNPPYRAALPQRIDIDSGIPGLALTHHVTRLYTAPGIDGGVPGAGHWKVTHTASDRTVGRCAIGFRTLHAAAHMAQHLDGLTDWTRPMDTVARDLVPGVLHAEAHAHEVDAAWPPGNTVPFSNGPSIIDDTGATRRFLAQAPYIDWDKADDGTLTCSVCGALPVHGGGSGG